MKFKISFQSIAVLLIVFSFTIDFGFLVGNNRIYIPFVITIILMPILLIQNIKIDKNIFRALLPLVFLLCCAVFSTANCLFCPINKFKGEVIGISSIKTLIYLSTDIFIVFVIIRYFKYNQFGIIFKIVKPMVILTIIYGIVELININLFHANPHSPLSLMLSFFHAGKWGLQDNYLSLLGWEHSFGIISSSCLYGFIVASLLCKNVIFKNRLIDLIIAITMLTLSIMTDSKGGFIMLILMHIAIVFAVIKDKNINKIILIPIIIIVLIFATVWGTTVSKYAGNIAKKDISSTYTRNSFLMAGLYMAKKYPILGVGISNFKFYYSESIDNLKIPRIMEVKDFADTNVPTSMPDAGNMFIGILCELGIIGFIIFLWFILELFQKVLWLCKIAKDKQERSLAYALFFSLVSIIGSFTHKYLFNIYLWWIFFGIILSVYLQYKKSIVKRSSLHYIN